MSNLYLYYQPFCDTHLLVFMPKWPHILFKNIFLAEISIPLYSFSECITYQSDHLEKLKNLRKKGPYNTHHTLFPTYYDILYKPAFYSSAYIFSLTSYSSSSSSSSLHTLPTGLQQKIYVGYQHHNTFHFTHITTFSTFHEHSHSHTGIHFKERNIYTIYAFSSLKLFFFNSIDRPTDHCIAIPTQRPTPYFALELTLKKYEWNIQKIHNTAAIQVLTNMCKIYMQFFS